MIAAAPPRQPGWLREATLGVFIHWGPYSVPAWAEPSGALGAVPDAEWFVHNAYAEWYANTIRLSGSPAAAHHEAHFGGAPYDAFVDAWNPSAFDADEWARLFARAGADYVVPTTKHHDGIALWDAPGRPDLTTVHRGPRRDLIAPIAAAVRERGMRLGLYYSGGLDWAVTDLPPLRSADDVLALRPVDADYNAYAMGHVRDLIDRFEPDLLWNDIDWPDAGKGDGPSSLRALRRDYLARVPHGVMNDRWGLAEVADYRTSEYDHDTGNEAVPGFEHCRGLGFSFGFTANEDAALTLDGPALARLWLDVVDRGGRLLINVGPTAEGRIPPLQRAALEWFGDWRAAGARREELAGD